MFKNCLCHKVLITHLTPVQNEFGEYDYEETQIEVMGYINAKRSKIVTEKGGIIEDIVYECIIPSNVEVSPEDKLEWNNLTFQIKQILPVIDLGGRHSLNILTLELKG